MNGCDRHACLGAPVCNLSIKRGVRGPLTSALEPDSSQTASVCVCVCVRGPSAGFQEERDKGGGVDLAA